MLHSLARLRTAYALRGTETLRHDIIVPGTDHCLRTAYALRGTETCPAEAAVERTSRLRTAYALRGTETLVPKM